MPDHRTTVNGALIGDLEAVARTLASLPTAPTIEGSSAAHDVRSRLVDQVDGYIVPRLRNLEAPLLIGIGGSTGAGKSTITNTLVDADVSPTGVVRPTTRTPVLVCAPPDEAWFRSDGVLHDLPRVSGASAAGDDVTGPLGLRVISHAGMLPGLAVLDTPDIDSIEVANHTMAARLLDASDMWLFVTTAARYADQVPWTMLDKARRQGTALSIIINRIPPGASAEIRSDLERMLDERGLAGTPVFTLTETPLIDGRIPDDVIDPISRRLEKLSANATRRATLVRQTLDGAIASVPMRAEVVLADAERRTQALAELGEIVDQQHGSAIRRIAASVDGGTLLRGEVLAGWQEFVGTGTFMKSVQSQLARIGDKLRSTVTRTPTTPSEVTGELRSTVVAAIVEAVDRAADSTVAAWETSPGGDEILGADARTLARPSSGLIASAEHEVAQWQDFVLGLVRTEASDRHLAARAVSLGINTVGVSMMIVIFAHTGGLTGGEVAVAGGTATLSQALLTAMFGEQAVRDLARRSRDELMERITRLVDAEAKRFHDRIGVGPTTAQLAAAQIAVQDLADHL